MSSSTTTTGRPAAADAAMETRIIREGYGPGAWHGPDLRAALSDVTPAQAFRRPGPERHNIAEIALHHAWYVHSVAAQLDGADVPFPVAAADWVELSEDGPDSWQDVVRILEQQYDRLLAAVGDAAGGSASRLSDSERFVLILGITCHAVYHAGQIQLIKVLNAA
jgi:hypothetical protein